VCDTVQQRYRSADAPDAIVGESRSSSLEVVPVHIVVLVKPVPVVGSERLDGELRTERGALELNGNDEYKLERALKLTEAHGGEVSLLAMSPATGIDALRKGLAIGATRAYHVVDDALAGSDIRATVAVLCVALRKIDPDLVFAGAGSSDGAGSVVSAAVAARLRLPYLGDAADIELVRDGTPTAVRVRRPHHGGHEVVQVGLPALVMGTQLLGEPRYPSLRGIMAARTREIVSWSLADLGLDPAAVGWAATTTLVEGTMEPPVRGGATVISAPPVEAAAAIRDLMSSLGLI